MTETEPETPEVPDYSDDHDRNEVAENLKGAMDEGFYNALEGRVRDAENERVRIKWLRAATDAATEYRQQLAELEKEEQERRIAELESRLDALMGGGGE